MKQYSLNQFNRHTYLLATLLLIGCSSHPNPALQRVQLDLKTAQKDAQLSTNAHKLLDEASNTLERAEHEWKKNQDQNETDHLVYLTQQTLNTAREETRRKVAQDAAQVHRDQARLAAGNLRADRDNANARANINELVARNYEQEAEQNRNLIRDLDKQVQALRTNETERGLEFTLAENVLFDSNRTELKSGAILKLSPLTNFLRANPDRMVTIEGHTDSRGSDDYNINLSQNRASSVQELLVAQGIATERITAKGLGKAYPIASNNTEAGRLQNRRVQIILSLPKV